MGKEITEKNGDVERIIYRNGVLVRNKWGKKREKLKHMNKR